MITAVVLIEAERTALPTLGSSLAEIPGVAEAYSVTGHWDFVAVVRVHEAEALGDVISATIGQLPGVVRTETLVAFQAYSRHDLEAMFAVGEQ
jgi:DNA-binding Lrp family transcriptional regulator